MPYEKLKIYKIIRIMVKCGYLYWIYRMYIFYISFSYKVKRDWIRYLCISFLTGCTIVVVDSLSLAWAMKARKMPIFSATLVGCQINLIDVNFHLLKSLEFFDKNSADNIWSKIHKEIKVSSLMPIRVKTLNLMF